MTLLELFQLLKKHLKLVITLPVVCVHTAPYGEICTGDIP